MNIYGRRLPTGKYTTSDMVYVRSWSKFNKCISKALKESLGENYIATAYDPGVYLALIPEGTKLYSHSMCLEISEARALAYFGGWKP